VASQVLPLNSLGAFDTALRQGALSRTEHGSNTVKACESSSFMKFTGAPLKDSGET
jgi:hypothetical protein